MTGKAVVRRPRAPAAPSPAAPKPPPLARARITVVAVSAEGDAGTMAALGDLLGRLFGGRS